MRYAVLYGQRGVKGFDTKSDAEKYARNKVQSNKGRVPVTIDRIDSYGGQRQIKEVKYKKQNKTKRTQSYNPFGKYKLPF